MPNTTRVALVQARPVYLDLEGSLIKASRLIEQAAQDQAKLVVFGETWLPGYPAWFDHCPDVALWDHAPVREVHARLRHNSVVVPSQATQTLSALAAQHRMVIAIGINERVEEGKGSGTLYNSYLLFNEEGDLVNHHRKLVPTHTERLVWGQGDGAGLRCVKTAMGRVGGLICWEHWMPLARQALHEGGERIHLALWPAVGEMHQVASRHYAFEGRCFVLAVGSLMTVADLPHELARKREHQNHPDHLVLRGQSAIIKPDGSYQVEPVIDRECVITADLDMDDPDRYAMTLDVSGHYHRPDVLEFKVHHGTRRHHDIIG